MPQSGPGWSDQSRTPKELLGRFRDGCIECVGVEGSLHSEEETGNLVPVSGLKDAESFVIECVDVTCLPYNLALVTGGTISPAPCLFKNPSGKNERESSSEFSLKVSIKGGGPCLVSVPWAASVPQQRVQIQGPPVRTLARPGRVSVRPYF